MGLEASLRLLDTIEKVLDLPDQVSRFRSAGQRFFPLLLQILPMPAQHLGDGFQLSHC